MAPLVVFGTGRSDAGGVPAVDRGAAGSLNGEGGAAQPRQPPLDQPAAQPERQGPARRRHRHSEAGGGGGPASGSAAGGALQHAGSGRAVAGGAGGKSARVRLQPCNGQARHSLQPRRPRRPEVRGRPAIAVPAPRGLDAQRALPALGADAFQLGGGGARLHVHSQRGGDGQPLFGRPHRAHR
eukprot:scaffold9396_cov100-Isochrysis_galbana.AAC.3